AGFSCSLFPVTCSLVGYYRLYLAQLVRAGDAAEDGAGGGDARSGQDDLGAAMAHAAPEVAVGGRDAALAVGDDAHIAAQTRPARRGAEDRAGFHEDLVETFLRSLAVHLLAARDDNQPDHRVHLVALDDFGGGTQIREPPVGATADDDLIDRHVFDLVGEARVRRQVRQGHDWPQV